MSTEGPLLPPRVEIARVTSANSTNRSASALATRDHELIQRWAVERQAQPATGEATSSGPSTDLHVADGGAGLRFNFPGVAPFRPIQWKEWLAHFDHHSLMFVYDNHAAGDPKSNRYRIVKAKEWEGVIG